MISRTAEYALRAVVCLAQAGGGSLPTRRLAAITRVPEGYLSKVLQALGRAGLVASSRGLNGGVALARPAEGLSVLEVVAAVDPVPRIRSCPLGLPGHGANLCPLHRKLDDAARHVEEAFRATSIRALLAEPGKSTPLCDAGTTWEGGGVRGAEPRPPPMGAPEVRDAPRRGGAGADASAPRRSTRRPRR